jgi:hypothetical protein
MTSTTYHQNFFEYENDDNRRIDKILSILFLRRQNHIDQFDREHRSY